MKNSIRKMYHLILGTILFIALTVLQGTSVVLAADTTPPVIDLSTLFVSKKTADPNEKVLVRVEIKDDSEVDSVSFVFANSGTDWGLAASGYENRWFTEVDTPYFGATDLKSITASDVYGNTIEYYNSKSDFCYQGYEGGEYRDLSAATFRVESGSYPRESDAPVVDFSSMKISSREPKLRQNVTLSFKVTDASPIAEVYVWYAGKNDVLKETAKYNSSRNCYEVEHYVDCYGTAAPMILEAVDAFGNRVTYADPNCDHFDKYAWSVYNAETDISMDMSKGKYTVSVSSGDHPAPVLKLKTVSFKKPFIKRNQLTKAYFKLDNPETIDDIDVWYGIHTPSHEFVTATGAYYNEENKAFEILFSSGIYGRHELVGMKITDVFGNTVEYTDRACDVYKGGFTPDGQQMDLSCFDFYVGIQDKKTSVFVSNSTMDGTTKLDVTEMELKGTEFKKLREAGYSEKNLYNVEVKGNCDLSRENAYLFFDAPEGFAEGDTLRIRHLQKNGKVQTQNSQVENGKIGIQVNQFSPFLIEVASKKDKSIVTVDGNKYRIKGASTAVYLGISGTKTATVTIPDTINVCNRTYKITEIQKDALKGNTKMKKLAIGKNVAKIGQNAFYGCKKLTSVTVKTTKLKSSVIGSKAFTGIPANASVKVPKSKLSAYRTLFAKKGMNRKIKIKS